jgi:asparagine synthase (glutamine-hydrolysing)
MCGIAGYLAEDLTSPNPSLLRDMCDRLRHRGPDAYGYFCNDRVALGHRRLSIIDVSGGNQPLGNEDGSIQVVFNGEIYNYLELRSELIRQGHVFHTNSDTEVLVHLYEDVGEKAPEYLNGMFAFAIWDDRRQELFLARDRFGKKPLYYSTAVPGTKFCFASELKGLTAIPGFELNVNPRSVADFLSLSYIPDPETIYEDVYKLLPGHSLTVGRTGKPRLRKYWEPRFSESSLQFSDAIEQIQSLASDAVQRRMISDVPLGAFLSGGVDSSAAVAFMSEHAPRNVKTFSIGFTNKKFDELEFARLVVRRYHTEHHEEVVTPSIEEMLGTLVEHFDEPFGDSSAIPTLYLARMTRQHVTVALCGDGADELFGGYRRYYFGVFEERLRQRFPSWFRQSVIKFGSRYYPKFDYLPQIFRAKTLLTNLSQDLADSSFHSAAVFSEQALRAVLSEDLKRQIGSYSTRGNFRERFRAVSHLAPLEQIQAVDLQTWLPGDILVKADRATMAYSLESRSPWLDYRLGELAFTLPAAFKINGRVGKFIFKRAVASRVPSALIERRKMGFSVPLAQWMRTSLKPVVQSTLFRPEMEMYIAMDEVRRLWNEHQSGVHNHDRRLWNLLILACWHYHHFEKTPMVETAGQCQES